MSEKIVEISKHSGSLIEVIKDKETIYYLNKQDAQVIGQGSNIEIFDTNRKISFDYTLVKTPSGNSLIEIVGLIQDVIES